MTVTVWVWECDDSIMDLYGSKEACERSIIDYLSNEWSEDPDEYTDSDPPADLETLFDWYERANIGKPMAWYERRVIAPVTP